MLAEQGIHSVLATVSGCQFWPVQLPDPDGSVPDVFGIYSKVGGNSFNSLDGDLGFSRVRMQVSVYTTSYPALKTIESAVNTAMQAANLAGTLVNVISAVPIDGYETDSRRYFCHMDFYCWAAE